MIANTLRDAAWRSSPLRAEIEAHMRRIGVLYARDILKEFGVSRAGDCPASKQAALLDRFNKAGRL